MGVSIDYSLSIATVFLPSSYQTAWLFSHDGLLISAGHKLKELSYNIGDLVDIQFPGRGKQHACIKELAFCEEENLDYCIMALEGSQGIAPLPIEWKRIKTKNSICELWSAKADGSCVITIIGKTCGYSGVSRSVKTGCKLGIQWRMTATESIEGASGGPLLIKRHGMWKVVGVQSFQFSSSTQKIASSIAGLRHVSPLIEQEYKKQRIALMPLSFEDNYFLYPKHLCDLGTRYVVFIVPFRGDDAQADELYNEIIDAWRDFELSLANMSNEFSVNKGWPKNLRLHPVLIPSRDPVSHKGGVRLSDYINRHQTDYPLHLIRCVVDLSGTIDLTVDKDISQVLGISHLVGVNVNEEATAMYAPLSADPYDFSFEVTDSNHDQLVNIIMRMLTDIYLDSCMFHSLPILWQTFADQEARREFSISKVRFANEFALSIYGHPVDEDTMGFISLAACTRLSVNHVVDLDAYKKLWRSFIEDHLYSSIGFREEGNAPLSCQQDVVDCVLGAPKIGKQISKSNLINMLSNLKAANGSLCVYVVCVGRPKGEASIKLAQCFKKTNYAQKMDIVVESSQIERFSKYAPYCKFWFFRKGWD
jgi:hypothetical protein